MTKSLRPPNLGRELRHSFPYNDEDKARLLKLVITFRKQQDKAFAKASERELSRLLRDFLGNHDFIGHIVDGWYVIESDDPNDPIKEVIQRNWLVVDNKYIIDTCSDRYHPGEEGYKVVVSRIGDGKNYSLIKRSKSAAKFNAKMKNFFKNPLKRKNPEEGISSGF